MEWKGLPLVIFGSKGMAKEVFNLVYDMNKYSVQPLYQILGFVENDSELIGKEVIGGYSVVACDRNFAEFAQRYPLLGVVIPMADPLIKSKIVKAVSEIDNLVFPNLVHPDANVGTFGIHMGVGNIFTAGCRVTCDITFGNFNLVNINTYIGHDVIIGNYCTLNPGTSISGAVHLEDGCLIGAGAIVLQNCIIGSEAIVGAGAVVTKNVVAETTVVGIPARIL